ncbi:MAG: 2,4-dihydroxyhept-2-ene-1,7-dioic acid aldolase [Chitinophagales bacterium]|nr:MAG: 2,4-dihydroxyhept-2-ene-1,7-dioic acid aldolase [Chitinophagales bacterium]
MNLKHTLKQNKLTIGSWITIGHPSVAEILCSAGFDWLTIDLEHSPIDLETAQTLIALIQGKGLKALVRVGKNEEVIIKRVMDAGADGVIVPMINSRQDAEQAVSFTKYPPAGKRGVGLARAQRYGTGFDAYKRWLEEEAIVIAQIEHVQAVDNIEEIIAVPGIDGTIIGPYDLSGSLGIAGQLDHPLLQEKVKAVEAACKKQNFPLGYHVIQSDHKKMLEKIREGYTFLAFSLDFFFLGDKAREEMRMIRS